MSKPSLGEPVYCRPESAEWPELLGAADAVLAESPTPGAPTTEGVQQLYGLVDGLDDAALEYAFVYGLGFVMCEVARELQDPKTYRSVIKEMGNIMLRNAGHEVILDENMPDIAFEEFEQTRGMTMADISGRGAEIPVARLAVTASAALPSGTRFLADTLTVAVSTRRQAQELIVLDGPSFDSEETHDPTAPAPEPEDMVPDPSIVRFDEIIRGTPAAEAVGYTGTLATGSVVLFALYRHGDRALADADEDRLDDFANGDTLFADVISPGDFMRLDMDSAGIQCAARLRLDRTDTDIGNCITINDAGKVQFDRDRSVYTPARELGPLRKPGVRLTNEHLRCSAVFVPGLIPTFIGLFKKAVLHADARSRRIYDAHAASLGQTHDIVTVNLGQQSYL